MSDDDDYMSEKFLTGHIDVCPGLPKRKADQREFEQYKKKLKSQQPKKEEQEANLRDEGLNTAISSSNKGFQMLAKMGFKSGTSLGTSNSGIKEPIPINVKAGKGGLGKQQKPTKRSTPNLEMTKEMEENFRKSVQEKKNAIMLRKAFFTAQTACLHLDQDNNLETPVKQHFWPFKVIQSMKKSAKSEKESDESDLEESEEGEEEEEEELITEELLDELVNYLREKYYYCTYCASAGTDEDDLNSFCPGPGYEDHNDEF